MPHLTRKVNYDVGLIRTVKFQLAICVHLHKERQNVRALLFGKFARSYDEGKLYRSCTKRAVTGQMPHNATGFSLESEKYGAHVAKKKKSS